jgi:hypothetical protein
MLAVAPRAALGNLSMKSVVSVRQDAHKKRALSVNELAICTRIRRFLAICVPLWVRDLCFVPTSCRSCTDKPGFLCISPSIRTEKALFLCMLPSCRALAALPNAEEQVK